MFFCLNRTKRRLQLLDTTNNWRRLFYEIWRKENALEARAFDSILGLEV